MILQASAKPRYRHLGARRNRGRTDLPLDRGYENIEKTRQRRRENRARIRRSVAMPSEAFQTASIVSVSQTLIEKRLIMGIFKTDRTKRAGQNRPHPRRYELPFKDGKISDDTRIRARSRPSNTAWTTAHPLS